ncbi:MAG: polyprenyl synthetase family protein [Thermoanaerobaculia bacterium]|nr:polyprenyl synthetase family protein [Thermoanaerobaculia bacterium]
MKVATSPSTVDVLPAGPASQTSALADSAEPAVGAGLPAGVNLLERLEGICADRGLANLADRLDDMVRFVATDMASFENEFSQFPRRPQLVGQSASHLLDLGGKRLRPLCLSLAARAGHGFGPRVLDLAIAVELVHAATLLHDDVVDMSDARRGAPTARSIFGNAASIFAGDWLLVEALRRVRRAEFPGLLESLFDTIEEMIFAESVQLENRGRLDMGREAYFQVVEGKTASVFRWAMDAGAAAGGLDEEQRAALAHYGVHLGITFQAVDDLLDLTGDPEKTGKLLFTDLGEGKMTLPLIFALERDDELAAKVEEFLERSRDGRSAAPAAQRVVDSLRRTGAVTDCLALARDHSRRAVEYLGRIPDGRARRSLETVAEAIVDRDL